MDNLNYEPSLNPAALPVQPPAASPAAPGVKIDDKAVQRIAGEAISQVEGVLDVEGGLADLLKGADDRTRGVTVETGDGRAGVTARIITEYGKNIPAIAEAVVARVSAALREMAGLEVSRVQVEVTDTMTREEYSQKAAKARGAQ